MESSLAHAVVVLGQDFSTGSRYQPYVSTNISSLWTVRSDMRGVVRKTMVFYFPSDSVRLAERGSVPGLFQSLLFIFDGAIVSQSEPVIALNSLLRTAIYLSFLSSSRWSPTFWTSLIMACPCSRYGFMETLETMLLTFTAEVFVGLRVYALSKRRKLVLYAAAFVLVWQWGIAIYAMSQSSLGTDQVQLLLPMDGPPPLVLPDLPKTDPYHICIFISVIAVAPWVEAFLCISLAFDGIAFLAITYFSFVMAREQGYRVTHLLRIIQRDGIVYFFVLFSSNLVWVLILFYARSSLKFIHAQPAMIVSAIMINRITLNLKEAASDTEDDRVEGWTVKTFEQAAAHKKYEDRSATRDGRESATLTGDLEMTHFGVRN
ncbi:hypothetical protein PM082_020743 [Marasmius tenuissimus]|nr:hypothetical protein PM082_020743 [Marasmius tenuissimus]